MSSNGMFMLLAASQPQESTCFNTITEDSTQLWHCQYGHLGLKNSPTQGDGTWFATTEDSYKCVQRLFGG